MFFIQNTKSGARVETDEIGKRIIESLPASFEQLVETFTTGPLYISPKLLDCYLALFRASGITEAAGSSGLEQAEVKGEGGQTSGANISVVLVAFNGEKFIDKTLASLYKQTLLPAELIVVDNASRDRTVDLVQRNFSKVKIIKNKKNYHYAGAVNIGMEAAAGDLVLLLHQDMVLKEDFIEVLYRRYQAEENKETAAAIVPQVRFAGLPAFIKGIGNFITEENRLADNYPGVVDTGQLDNLSYVGSACFGAIMVTKSGWRQVGPLDRRYKHFYEDADWGIRAHLKGLKLLAAPRALAYRETPGSYSPALKTVLTTKNSMRFVLKNLQGKLRKTFFKKYLKQDIKNNISFIRNKCFRNIFYYIRAYLKLLVELPGIFSYRRKNRANSEAEAVEAFFSKGPPYVVLANEGADPLINRHAIRSYYYFTGVENFQYPPDPIEVQPLKCV